MGNLNFSLPLLIILLLTLQLNNNNAAAESSTSFIESSCRATRYPELCVKSLSGYATTIRHSKRQLVQTALSISLTNARLAAAFVSNLSKNGGISKGLEYQAVKDCIENMGDTVDRLNQSVKELRDLRGTAGGGDFLWHLSNVQTWVSAALTDETTCLDGFAGRRRRFDAEIKANIRRRITFVAHLTTNALALLNRFANPN